MNNFLSRFGFGLTGVVSALVFSGCGTATVKGTFLSGEKNIWISDMNNAEIMYCMSNQRGDAGASPVCTPARRGSESSTSSMSKPIAPPSVLEEKPQAEKNAEKEKAPAKEKAEKED